MSGPSLRQFALATLAFSVVGVVVYGSVVDNGYAFDAFYTVRDNPQTQRGVTLGDVFSSPYWTGEAAVGRGLYRPLTVLSFQLTGRVSEEPVAMHHAIDLVFHVLCCLALMTFLMQMGARFGVASTLALLFLLHPVHSEVVVSLVGRADLLATLFALLAMNLALARRVPGPDVWIGIFALFLLSLLSKESAVGLVLILPACWVARGVWLGEDSARAMRGALGLVISLGLALACVLAVRQVVLGDLLVAESAIHGDTSRGFFELRWRALAFTSLYVQKLVWPHPLLPDYLSGVVPLSGIGLHLRAIAAGVVLAASLAWPAWAWFRDRKLSRSPLGVLLFWVAAAPVCNLIIQIGTPFGERLLYFPSIFLLLAAIDLPLWRPMATMDWDRGPSWWPVWIVFFIAMGMAGAGRTPEWRSNRTLFHAAVRDCPENYYSQMSFGATLMRDGGGAFERELTIEAFGAASRIQEDAYAPWSMLGQIYYAEADYQAARNHFEEADRRAKGPERKPSLLNLARTYRALNDFARTESLLVPASKAHPEWIELQRELGDYWLSRDNVSDALVHFERVIEGRPDDVAIWRALIWSHLMLGHREAAAERIESAPPGTLDFRFKLQLEREGLELTD